MVRLTSDPRIKDNAHLLLVLTMPRRTPSRRIPGRKITWGVHLYSWDGRHVVSFDRRVTVERVLPHIVEATTHTPGFARRLEAYVSTLKRPALTPAAVQSLLHRFAHNHPAVRDAALRDALRLGAPAYRALRPLRNAGLDVETRRRVGSIVSRLEPLALMVKKRGLKRPLQRLSESRVCEPPQR